MKKKGSYKKLNATSYLMSRGIYWLALAILLPMLVAYFQTYRTGETYARTQSERILDFFIAEVDDILGETERTMDGYLLKTQGSCASSDLLGLRRYVATHDSVVAMGIIAADGKIACSIGAGEFEKLTFPVHEGEIDRKIDFAELRQGKGALPVLIKAAANGIRIYAIVSDKRFRGIFLPGFVADYSQIDLVLPKGGLWYSASGDAISSGFTEDAILIEQESLRFPINLSLVLDRRSIADWSGSLRVSLITIVLMSFAALLLCFLGHRTYHIVQSRRLIQQQMITIENARLNFEMKYQPLMNLDSKLLVGVVVSVDLSLFDKVPQAKPPVADILATIWDEIGEFAVKRREFNIIVKVEGEDVVSPDHRSDVVEKLKEIGYENMTLLMNWQNDRGVDPDIYRPLEEVATAGTNLAIDCGNVQFSLLSDMWAWPYHQLIIDFSSLPDSDEAMNWISEIVMNMSEELQVDTVAIGLDTKEAQQSAVGSGFQVGAGHYYAPLLTVDSLMAAVRPVRNKNKQTGENDAQNQAA